MIPTSADVQVNLRQALTAFAVLAALALVQGLVDLAGHLALAALVVAPAIGAFYAGRRYERRKPQDPPRTNRVGPGPADQVALLEHLAARPIESIIASYERVARYHHGGQS